MGGSHSYPDIKRAFRCLAAVLFRTSHPADDSHTRVYPDEAFIAFFYKSRTHKQSLAAVNQALSCIPIGTTTVRLSNQLLWHCLTPVANTMWNDLPEVGLCGMDDLASAKAMKVAETAYRRTNRWLDGRPMKLRELSSVIGVTLMTGRARHEGKWEKERDDRCNPDNVLKYLSPIDGQATTAMNALRKNLFDIMEPLVSRKRLEDYSWDTHIRSHQAWLAAGTVGGAKIEHYNKEDNPVPAGAANKRILFEYLSNGMLSTLIDEGEPQLLACASDKFENGKDRAIYGTMIQDYVIFSYILRGLESRLPNVDWCETGQLGYLEVLNMLTRLQKILEPGCEASMGDFTNFNLQHSGENIHT